MDGLCECGCGHRTKLAPTNHARRGWVKGQPLRFLKGHATRKPPATYIEEDRGHETPCWIWQGSMYPSGYGLLERRAAGKRIRKVAHRVFYVEAFGPIPDTLQLDHLCRVRGCVRPDHLEPVTHAENGRRGAGAKLYGQAADIVARWHDGESQSAIARSLGVHPSTVNRLVHGHRWADIERRLTT